MTWMLMWVCHVCGFEYMCNLFLQSFSTGAHADLLPPLPPSSRASHAPSPTHHHHHPHRCTLSVCVLLPAMIHCPAALSVSCVVKKKMDHVLCQMVLFIAFFVLIFSIMMLLYVTNMLYVLCCMFMSNNHIKCHEKTAFPIKNRNALFNIIAKKNGQLHNIIK